MNETLFKALKLLGFEEEDWGNGTWSVLEVANDTHGCRMYEKLAVTDNFKVYRIREEGEWRDDDFGKIAECGSIDEVVRFVRAYVDEVTENEAQRRSREDYMRVKGLM